MGAATHTQTTRLHWRAGGFFALALIAFAPRAFAVRCSNPDNLCRGNPCVTKALEVEPSCTVDFGNRDLVIGGTLTVPNGGTLTLRARTIDVRRAIVARHATRFQGMGGKVNLIATEDITVHWRIDASARTVPGEIHLTAGSDVRLFGRLRAATNGPNPQADGGVISVDAGGVILSVGLRARIRADGAAGTRGGTVTLSAASGVSLQGRVRASGGTGGSIAVVSTNGAVSVAQPIDARGMKGSGGSVALFAVNGALNILERVQADGQGLGGTLYLIGGGAVSTFASVSAGSSPATGTGGNVIVASNGDVTLREPVIADGNVGGTIQAISTGGALQILSPFVAHGKSGAGGQVTLRAGTTATVDSNVDADGGSAGGAVSLDGRTVEVTNRGGLFARGDIGGTIEVSGNSVTVAPGAKVLVDGDVPGGRIRFDATAGDLTLSGDFRARGDGGRIVGAASHRLVADGMFAARGNGCIGLSAGATLDISAGDFDVPVLMSCP